jgi:hypothetical protein
MDPVQRAKYDEEWSAGPPAPGMPLGGAPRPPAPDVAPPPPPPGPAAVDPPPAPPPRSDAGFEFVKRASLSKIREAIADVLGAAEPLPAHGFDLAIVTRAKKGLFKRTEESLCLLLKFVPFVDAAAINDVWLPAAKARAAGATDTALLLMGQGLASARELGSAVTDLRRKSRGGGPLVVPVDVRDWEALFPPETPGPVRSLIQRLKDEKR